MFGLVGDISADTPIIRLTSTDDSIARALRADTKAQVMSNPAMHRRRDAIKIIKINGLVDLAYEIDWHRLSTRGTSTRINRPIPE